MIQQQRGKGLEVKAAGPLAEVEHALMDWSAMWKVGQQEQEVVYQREESDAQMLVEHSAGRVGEGQERVEGTKLKANFGLSGQDPAPSTDQQGRQKALDEGKVAAPRHAPSPIGGTSPHHS